jgi:hypothetical protein
MPASRRHRQSDGECPTAAPRGGGGPVVQLDVEIDNYQGGEWSFMGQPYKIKRALLIPYRYEVRNNKGEGSGVWAIGQLLIGYIGGDGGG